MDCENLTTHLSLRNVVRRAPTFMQNPLDARRRVRFAQKVPKGLRRLLHPHIQRTYPQKGFPTLFVTSSLIFQLCKTKGKLATKYS